MIYTLSAITTLTFDLESHIFCRHLVFRYVTYVIRQIPLDFGLSWFCSNYAMFSTFTHIWRHVTSRCDVSETSAVDYWLANCTMNPTRVVPSFWLFRGRRDGHLWVLREIGDHDLDLWTLLTKNIQCRFQAKLCMCAKFRRDWSGIAASRAYTKTQMVIYEF